MIAIVLLYTTLAAAVLGTAFAWGMVVDADHDLSTVRRIGLTNGVETMYASRYRQAWFGLVYSVLLAVQAAVIAILITPGVARRPEGMRWEVYAVLAAMLVAALTLAGDGWLARREVRRAEMRTAGTLFRDGTESNGGRW